MYLISFLQTIQPALFHTVTDICFQGAVPHLVNNSESVICVSLILKEYRGSANVLKEPFPDSELTS